MRFSPSVIRIGTALLAAASALLQPCALWSQPSAIRPPVVLDFAIEAAAYRTVLADDKVAALQASLADSAQNILRDLYPFLQWNGANAADTVVIRVVDEYPPALMMWTRLKLTVRAGGEKRLRDSAYFVEFEPLARVFAHRVGPSAWTLDTLRAEMAQNLRKALAEPSLLSNVFGRIPLRASANIVQGKGLVPVHARDIGASDAQTPTFGLTARVVDATSADTGEFELTACLAGREVAYSCTVAQLEYARAKLVILPPRLDTLLRAVQVTPQRLLLRRFERDPLASRSGAVLPPH